jgi:hypothetical protein
LYHKIGVENFTFYTRKFGVENFTSYTRKFGVENFTSYITKLVLKKVIYMRVLLSTQLRFLFSFFRRIMIERRTVTARLCYTLVGREKRQTGSALIDIDEIDSAMTSLVRF